MATFRYDENTMSKLSKVILMVTMTIALISSSGCMSIYGRVDADLYGMRKVGGVYPFRSALKGAKPTGMWVPLVLIDLPLSLVVDTALLPLDIVKGGRSYNRSRRKPATKPNHYEPQEGDLVFQALPLDLDLVVAIEGVTESHYSHVGVLHKRDGEWTVIEASSPGVIYTPFEKWKTHGRNMRWAAFRLKAEHQKHIPQFLANLHPHAGKAYDFKYELSENKLYCSELVYHAWKKTTRQEMGKLTRIGDLNWKPHQTTIEKYNGGPIPLDRKMISPIELSKADQLQRVYNHGLDK